MSHQQRSPSRAKKRSLPFRDDASPAPPDDAKLVSRSSTVGQVFASEKTFHSRFRRACQSSQHCKGWGLVGSSLVTPWTKSEGTLFSLATGRDCRNEYRGTHIGHKYTCAEETIPVCRKVSKTVFVSDKRLLKFTSYILCVASLQPLNHGNGKHSGRTSGRHKHVYAYHFGTCVCDCVTLCDIM